LERKETEGKDLVASSKCVGTTSLLVGISDVLSDRDVTRRLRTIFSPELRSGATVHDRGSSNPRRTPRRGICAKDDGGVGQCVHVSTAAVSYDICHESAALPPQDHDSVCTSPAPRHHVERALGFSAIACPVRHAGSCQAYSVTMADDGADAALRPCAPGPVQVVTTRPSVVMMAVGRRPGRATRAYVWTEDGDVLYVVNRVTPLHAWNIGSAGIAALDTS